ncbi:ABC transporter substrate-binding protein [Arenivirga flava]|uniref:Sugar-binding protein n=1 Tax=Arenivirga flava TaxID=1930060 RepID=A0AA37UTZ7_9MICO|nr:extracellular solute-binding protein [Arenivirga flava]GMA28387.1 sugar-binding protein [Arenivirga flava]
MKIFRTPARGAAGLTVAALSIAALAGCAPASSDGPNENRPEGEIHVAVYGDAAASVEQAAADRFNEDSEIKVVIDSIPGDSNYGSAVRTSLGTDNAPDIFMSWGAADIEQLVDAGALLPLDEFIAEDPALRDSFIPTVFDEQVIDDEAYGIPMRGTAPTFLFYNEQVLADAGLEPAQSLDELLDQTEVLAADGVTPVALAGADVWPTQMWFQYLFARQLGNEAVADGLSGDADVWESEGSRTALTELRDLVDAGTFGTSFDSVGYSNQGTTALLSQGRAAYELMGTWNYATLAAADADFAENDLGWVAFPELTGGAGAPGDIAGNLANYYNVAADTRYPEAVAGFLAELYSDDFQNDQLAIGNLPPTTNAGELVAANQDLDARTKEYLDFVIGLVEDAPSFQLSWDRAVPTESTTRLLDAISGYTNGSLDADQWVEQMQSLTATD